MHCAASITQCELGLHLMNSAALPQSLPTKQPTLWPTPAPPLHVPAHAALFRPPVPYLPPS